MINPFLLDAPGFERLLIVGAGGFGREVAWLARQRWGENVPLAFLVSSAEYLTPPVNDVTVQMLDVAPLLPGDRYVSAISDSTARRALSAMCEARHLQAASVIAHPRIESSRFVEAGEGSILCAGTSLTTDVRIGRHVHVNLHCTIGHDVVIGDFSTLSPGVHVSGHVRIEEDVFIGTGAVIVNGKAGHPLIIGRGAIVAAGACVTRTVEPGALVAGVPAIRKR